MLTVANGLLKTLFGGGDSNLYGYVLGDPVSFVDPSGEFGIVGAGIVVGMAWGFTYYYNWLTDYSKKDALLKEQRKRIDKWCAEVGEFSWKCQEMRKDNYDCVLDTAKDLTQSGAQLPGIEAGGPAPIDILAPIIGETINAIND